jgi:hypothetical protein
MGNHAVSFFAPIAKFAILYYAYIKGAFKMANRLTQTQVEQEFQAKGCQLLSEYQGNTKSMKYRCSCGLIAQTSLIGFRKSKGCYNCSAASGGRRFSYEEVKKYFEEQGCELLEKEYKRSVDPITYRCSCGTVARVDFGNFRRGRRCLNCKSKKNSAELRTSESDLNIFCNKHGCQLVRSWIQCKRTRIEYICKCGNQVEAYWSNFTRFPNCWECGKKKKSGVNCYMYDPDRDAVKMRKRFRKMCGQFIHRYMRATGEKKTRYTHELLGYTPQQLQDHILNHPNMKLCEGKEWHVDHYFPIQAFLDAGIYDLKIINCLPNLRPMPGPENLSKADKYNEKEFNKWLKLLSYSNCSIN